MKNTELKISVLNFCNGKRKPKLKKTSEDILEAAQHIENLEYQRFWLAVRTHHPCLTFYYASIPFLLSEPLFLKIYSS